MGQFPPCERAIGEGRAREFGQKMVAFHAKLSDSVLQSMRDDEGQALLRELKLRRYGDLGGPSWHYVFEAALNDSKTQAAADIAVVQWLLRTHGPPIDAQNRWCNAVLKPTERLRALEAAGLCWAKSEDPAWPWTCQHGGFQLSIQIGDFPVEHLYLINVDGRREGVVDDWPANWRRESWIASRIS